MKYKFYKINQNSKEIPACKRQKYGFIEIGQLSKAQTL